MMATVLLYTFHLHQLKTPTKLIGSQAAECIILRSFISKCQFEFDKKILFKLAVRADLL